MAHATQKDGGLMKSYMVLSWIILRIYALAFGGIAYIAVKWWQAESVYLTEIALGLDPTKAIALLFVFTMMLLLPPLTPAFLRCPRSVLMGSAKAVAIAAFSYYFYLVQGVILASGFVPMGDALAPILPLVIKALAGTAITGAVLVGLGQQLKTGLRQGAGLRDNQISPQDLRSLRQARMYN